MAQLEITSRDLYTQPERRPARGGCLDPRLGVSDSHSICETCGLKLVDCVGHFGFIPLELPVFHVGYFKFILTTLQVICKSCSHILLSKEDQQNYLKLLRKPSLDASHRKSIVKKIIDKAKKSAASCANCGAYNGTVRKVPPLKIIHEKYKITRKSNARAPLACCTHTRCVLLC
jgi:DNA-directed RNA polymerase III subunit RPC1